MSATEGKFQKIAEKAISDAEVVKCSIEEFKEGLDLIIEELRERRAMEGK